MGVHYYVIFVHFCICLKFLILKISEIEKNKIKNNKSGFNTYKQDLLAYLTKRVEYRELKPVKLLEKITGTRLTQSLQITLSTTTQLT